MIDFFEGHSPGKRCDYLRSTHTALPSFPRVLVAMMTLIPSGAFADFTIGSYFYEDDFEGGPADGWWSDRVGLINPWETDGSDLAAGRQLLTPILPLEWFRPIPTATPTPNELWFEVEVRGAAAAADRYFQAPIAVSLHRGHDLTPVQAPETIPFPLDVTKRRSSPTHEYVTYSGAIDLDAIPPTFLGQGYSIGFSDLYGSWDLEGEFAIGSVSLDWSRPAAGRVKQTWEPTVAADGDAAFWRLWPTPANWREDANYLRSTTDCATNDPEVCGQEDYIVDTPPFRFTDIANAVVSIDFDLSKYTEGPSDSIGDFVSITLIDPAGFDVGDIGGWSIDDLIDSGPDGVTQGLLNGRLVKPAIDAFEGAVPRSHVDGESVYRVRTRIGDYDGVLFSSGVGIGAIEISHAVAHAPGDFNADGTIDAADYTVWRDAVVSGNLEADGNRDGVVDESDYMLWADSYADGAVVAAPVPEPSVGALVLTLTTASAFRSRPIRRKNSPPA